jgi:hypothetical protein
MLWDAKGGNPENISKDNPYDSATWFGFYSFNHVVKIISSFPFFHPIRISKT